MPIRDLEYPEDARRVIDSLHAALRYDAAVAVLGLAAAQTEVSGSSPDFSVGFRFGGRAEDEAVRRDAPGLLSRYSLISMISRIDRHAQLLLLQRRVLEHLGGSGKRMDSGTMWAIQRRIASESRKGIVKLCSELVVEEPSPGLLERMEWLEGLVRLRNCLSHRLGQVQLEDVKRPGATLERTEDTHTLKVLWLRPKAFVDGVEITSFPHQGGELDVSFAEDQREWAIGDQVEVTPLDCQAIAMSLSLFGDHLLVDFEREMNRVLGV